MRFLKGSKIDFTLGFGCSIIVESSEGKWENFRSFYSELYAKLSLEVSSNDSIKKMRFVGDIEDLKVSRLKIFKKNESMIVEETTLSMMANMGLNMAKSQASQLLDIPSISYPTIKKCTGLKLLRPSINIYDGFIVIASDLEVGPAERGCDIMTPAEFEVTETFETTGIKGIKANKEEHKHEAEEDVKEDL